MKVTLFDKISPYLRKQRSLTSIVPTNDEDELKFVRLLTDQVVNCGKKPLQWKHKKPVQLQISTAIPTNDRTPTSTKSVDESVGSVTPPGATPPALGTRGLDITRRNRSQGSELEKTLG